MKEAIVEKIDALVAAGVNSERDSLYLVVQLHKLVEQAGIRADYPSLSFYRDWAVHARLSHSHQASALLRDLNGTIEWYELTRATQDFIDRISSLISMRELHQEIRRIVDEFQVHAELVDDLDLWHSFIKYLVMVLIDLPLETSEELSKVHTFSFSFQDEVDRNRFARSQDGPIAIWLIELRGDATRYSGPVFLS